MVVDINAQIPGNRASCLVSSADLLWASSFAFGRRASLVRLEPKNSVASGWPGPKPASFSPRGLGVMGHCGGTSEALCSGLVVCLSTSSELCLTCLYVDTQWSLLNEWMDEWMTGWQRRKRSACCLPFVNRLLV